MVETPTVRQQQITFFCNGRAFVYDLTELQVRAIILFASEEMEEKNDRKGSKLASISLQPQVYKPPGFSLKRSLQRFLQKRKQRNQASSPYK
ncbi:hypothetical protein FEM48_Zijuj04G0148700 [Ziziphus jujuba var. spinosa]|uniref:Protein TIFY n=1 Tax=Ziziphus jujuba var. spinosa TaxID=714518 RepID=A0A978VKH8_ZIZJJ|nr:hypothetical protein FEM48_Zijuj04G0148700 [Ziziphus jujuba var. spinosa]